MNNHSAVVRTWKRTLGTTRAQDGNRPTPLLSFLACMVAVAALLYLGADGAMGEAIQSVADPGTGPGPHGDESATAPPPPESPTWRLGENLEAGDSYTYEVCYSIHAAETTHPDPCYTLRMDFVYRMIHHAYGPVWVMDVGFDGKSTVMLLDLNTMTVHPMSAWDVWLAGSIQDTVLHLAPYGEQGLGVGAYWGEIDAYFYSVPLSVTSKAGDKSVLGYDTTAESRTVIMSGMPFPEYSRWHDPRSLSADPRIMHEYALVR